MATMKNFVRRYANPNFENPADREEPVSAYWSFMEEDTAKQIDQNINKWKKSKVGNYLKSIIPMWDARCEQQDKHITGAAFIMEGNMPAYCVMRQRDLCGGVSLYRISFDPAGTVMSLHKDPHTGVKMPLPLFVKERLQELKNAKDRKEEWFEDASVPEEVGTNRNFLGLGSENCMIDICRARILPDNDYDDIVEEWFLIVKNYDRISSEKLFNFIHSPSTSVVKERRSGSDDDDGDDNDKDEDIIIIERNKQQQQEEGVAARNKKKTKAATTISEALDEDPILDLPHNLPTKKDITSKFPTVAEVLDSQIYRDCMHYSDIARDAIAHLVLRYIGGYINFDQEKDLHGKTVECAHPEAVNRYNVLHTINKYGNAGEPVVAYYSNCYAVVDKQNSLMLHLSQQKGWMLFGYQNMIPNDVSSEIYGYAFPMGLPQGLDESNQAYNNTSILWGSNLTDNPALAKSFKASLIIKDTKSTEDSIEQARARKYLRAHGFDGHQTDDIRLVSVVSYVSSPSELTLPLEDLFRVSPPVKVSISNKHVEVIRILCKHPCNEFILSYYFHLKKRDDKMRLAGNILLKEDDNYFTYRRVFVKAALDYLKQNYTQDSELQPL